MNPDSRHSSSIHCPFRILAMQQEHGAAENAAPLPVSASPAASPLMGRAQRRFRILLVAGALALLGAAAWNISHTAWYQERRYSGMSLVALMWERDARNSYDPILLYTIGRRMNEQGRYAEADGYLREAVL